MIRKTLFAALAALAVGTPAAKAGLLPVTVSVNPQEGNFRWTYAIVLPTNMKLQSGDYFTVYDFAGLVPNSGTVTGTDNTAWTMSVSKVGPTPARLNPSDDATIDNITWTYNGADILTGQVGLGNFAAASTFDTSASSFLTARNPRALDGVIDSNITETQVPTGTVVTPPSGVPEPTTLALAALGLPVLAGRRLFGKKKVA